MDLLDDIFSEPSAVKAPAGGRFPPKAKLRPKKGPSAAVPSDSAKASKEQPVTSVPADSVFDKSVEPNESVEKNVYATNKSSFTDDGSAGTNDTSFSKEAITLENPLIIDNISADASKMSADASLGLQSPEDTIPQSTTAPDRPLETPSLNASNTQNEEEVPGLPRVSFASTSPFRPCSVQTESGRYKEALIGNAGDFQIDMEQGAQDFCIEAIDSMSEAATGSGRKAVKFKPKPKAQSGRKKDPVKAVSDLSYASKVPSENQHITRSDAVHSGEPAGSDLSHVRLDGNSSIDPSTAQPDGVMSEDIDSFVVPSSQNKSGKDGDKISDTINVSHESLDGGGGEAVEKGYEFHDGVNDEFHDNSSFPSEVPNETAKSRSDNDDSLREETSKKKGRKSKEVASKNDKPGRKRKKATKEPDQSTEKPPKKFPRATRRKRCVNKSLLEAPEDEIDLQRVPIRDLIILAEYRERKSKKEAATVQPPSTNERTSNTLPEDQPYDDDDDEYNDTYGFDQDRGSFDNPPPSVVRMDDNYYNYQSFMEKKPRVRWSKHDTELFYQGVRQFGSDLSLIQQLFPGRTRHQIKLKYKKEDRQNPMMLQDALTSRAKDLSQFELVIGRLQEQAAQEEAEQGEQMSGEDDSARPTDKDEMPDEETLETHEQAAKSKQNEESSTANQEPDTAAQVQSPPKSHDSEEEDDFDWNEYKSEI